MHEAEAGTAIRSDPDKMTPIGVADAAGSTATVPAPAPPVTTRTSATVGKERYRRPGSRMPRED